MYITRAQGGVVYAIDREARMRKVLIDASPLMTRDDC